jgi:hypothetical protein
MSDNNDMNDRANIAKSLFLMSQDHFRVYMMTVDKFGIYRQRKALGLPVWRGYEWWMS